MPKQFPFITAHSGCMNMPDNTLASAEIGLKLGADVFEDDVRITRDGILVLAHNDIVHLPDGTKYSISESYYRELCELSIIAAHGTETIRLATLESFLQFIKLTGKIANLDLKVDECITAVSDLVQKYGMMDQVIISGCEPDRAMKVQQVNPHLRKVVEPDNQLFSTLDYMKVVDYIIDVALTTNSYALNMDYRFVKSELMEAAKHNNLPVLVWTVNDEADMKRMIEMGVDTIATRNVKALVELKQRYKGAVGN